MNGCHISVKHSLDLRQKKKKYVSDTFGKKAKCYA